MEKFTHTDKYTHTTHTYEVVDEIPNGYLIWNIGHCAPEGYLPLCRPAAHQPFPGGRHIDADSLKAIKIDGAEDILAAVGYAEQNTLSEMERYVKRYRNSKTKWVQHRVALCRKAIPVMRKIKGIENLMKW